LFCAWPKWSMYFTNCCGVVMKSFQTTSIAIFTPFSFAQGIALRISAEERSQTCSKFSVARFETLPGTSRTVVPPSPAQSLIAV